MSQYSIKDTLGTPSAGNIGAFGGNPNMFGAINQGLQPNLLQELLKIQGNNNNNQQHQQQQQQLMGVNPLGQQQQQLQQNQPLFGQGFLNAASLLANIQQLQQPQNIVGDKSPSTTLQQPIGGAQNMLALQQFMNINSNLNQYQSFIDQIEKQQQPTPQQLNQFAAANFGGNGNNVSTSVPNNSRAGQQPSSQVSSPIQNMPSYSTSLPTQAPSYVSQPLPTPLNSSMLPSQSDLIRQPLKSSAVNFHEMIEKTGLPQHSNYSYLMTTVKGPEISEQENYGEKSNSKHDNYMYQEVKNTVSNPTVKERQQPSYNPMVYSGKPSINPALSGDEYSYEGQQPQSSYSVQRSPSGAQKISIPNGGAGGNRRNNEGGSPKVQWLSGNNTRSTQQEPLSYLSNGNNKFSEGQNSPPNRNSASRGYQNELYGNNPTQLNSSFNQAAANQNIYHQLNASQNSSQVDANQNQYYKNYKKPTQFQQQHQQQYSPGSSNYRFEDANQNDQVNSSINFGQSQKLQPQSANINMSQQAVNIDDIPVGPTRPKTFEELLEENLRKMGQDPNTLPEPTTTGGHFNRGEEDERQQKKEFLKRKSQKAAVTAAPPKKYNYYVDNFDENKKKDQQQRSTSAAPERTSGFGKSAEETPIYQKAVSREHPQEHTPNHNRAVSPMDNYNDRSSADNQPASKPNKPAQKKTFLTRGSGTAGGKQGHPQPAQKSKKKGQKKNGPLLSDDEYPNDFNFAAEQDNKSPKLNNQQQQQQQTYLSRQNVASKRSVEADLNRNSIAEFEKLEQECSKSTTQQAVNHQRVPPQLQSMPGQLKKQNQRRKKLFDDSDSNDNDDDDEEDIDDHQHQNLSQHIEESKANNKSGIFQGSQHANNSETEGDGKSAIVKKFFYKEDPTTAGKKPQSQIPRIPLSSSAATDMSSQLEQAMKQKMEQLNQAIETYNQQTEGAHKMKREYEQLVAKQRVDFREFETRKKKELEDIDRLRNDEVDKLKKDKKALEQRQRNMQMVQTSNKKEREEIEFLKRELQRVVEESKAKEGKSKAQIERLAKQGEELKMRNKELQDELKHLAEQFKSAAGGVNQKGSANNVSGQSASQQAAAAASRYTFSTNKSQEQLHPQQQQQPKGILKNNTGNDNNNRAVSSNYFYDNQQPLEEDDEEDEEEQVRRRHHLHTDEEEDDNGEAEHRNQSEEDEHVARNSRHNNNNNQRMEESRQQPPANLSGIISPQPAAAVNEEEESEEFDMKFPVQYHSKTPANMKVVEQIIGNDGKIQRVYENGKKEVIFNNGVKREVFPDGYTIVYFNNNDIKQTYADQRVVYYFAEARTTQTTFPDGLQVFKFANNQIEKHFPDGTKEIIFPDGTIKCIFADGEEESIFPDGTIQRIEKNGVKAIEFANGQKDIMFPDGTKIREYPDGKVRKTYPDGKTEYTHRPLQP